MTISSKHVLVCGGGGFVGSHLVERLIEHHPRSITVLDNFTTGHRANLSGAMRQFPALRIREGDACNSTQVEHAMENGVDVVFNLTVLPLPLSLRDPALVIRNNIDSVMVLCELLRRGKFQTLMHFSSSEVYGTAEQVPMTESHPRLPLTPYAASKSAGDDIVLTYARTFGLDCRILRPFNNFGPRQNAGQDGGVIPKMVLAGIAGRPFEIHGDGLQTRDFVYVKDTAKAAIAAYEREPTRGRVINIASGKEISILDLARTLQTYFEVPPPIVFKNGRTSDVRRHRGARMDFDRLVGHMEFETVEHALRETVEWYKHADTTLATN